MEEDPQREAWDSLYSGQGRPWRGVTDVSWTGIRGGRVLDLGCGNGKTTEALVEAGAEVTGVDFSEAAVASCRENLGGRAEFAVADARDLPFPDGSFDAVVAVHVFEHVPREDVPRACSEAMRVLVPGGRLYMQAFALGDFRSRGRKEDVRNGILYRYLTEADVIGMFPGQRVVSIRRRDETTRFGKERRRLQCVIEKCQARISVRG